MIAVDTNILVYAHRRDSLFHQTAKERLVALAESRTAWAIPWPCVHEFFNVVTHPRIYNPPTPLESALRQIDVWLDSPSVVLLSEPDQYWSALRPILERSRVNGPRVHDARIVAICRSYDIRELWTADRDFSRFPELSLVNPLVRR